MESTERSDIMTRRYALRDDQWERIKDLLPGRKGTVGVTARDNRLFVEAVLYRLRAGIPWRDLPERFGNWHRVYARFKSRGEPRQGPPRGVGGRSAPPPGRHPLARPARALRQLAPCVRALPALEQAGRVAQ